jgi:hypothetical protein
VDGKPSVVIHNKRFWRRYPDGRMERIYMNEKIKGALWSIKAATARDANDN